MLDGVKATNPVTFAAVIALICVVATLAAVVPARLAVRVDPVIALRAQ
jgi:ABC-type antimicrobial peptide transport system permease subunit